MVNIINSSPLPPPAGFPGARTVERIPGAPSLTLGEGEEARGFGDLLKSALSETNRLQAESDLKSRALLAGESRNIHETMVAMEKAGIAFRFVNQVRNRAVEAYREILRMQL